MDMIWLLGYGWQFRFWMMLYWEMAYVLLFKGSINVKGLVIFWTYLYPPSQYIHRTADYLSKISLSVFSKE